MAPTTRSRAKASAEAEKRALMLKSIGKESVRRVSKTRKSNKRDCVSCTDTFPKNRTVELQCHHLYCHTCLRTMALTAVTDEQLYLPKCCTEEIPSTTLLPIMNRREKTSLTAKAEEFQTLLKERWYCPAMQCGQWIPSQKGSRSRYYRICPHCRATICIYCRGLRDPQHKCDEIKKDETLEAAFLKMAKRRKWKQRPNCNAMVQRISGCTHIYCRCRTSFCYRCGYKIGNCTCVRPATNRGAQHVEFVADDS